MRLPFNGSFVVTQTYDQHIHNGNLPPGVDFGCPIGTPLYAIEDGQMTCATDGTGAHYIELTAKNTNHNWFYVHLSEFVGFNRFVKEGDLIGYSGNSGITTGPHLHFGLKVNNIYIDPYPILFVNQDTMASQEYSDLKSQLDAQVASLNTRIDHISESLVASQSQLATLIQSVQQLNSAYATTLQNGVVSANTKLDKLVATITTEPVKP